MKIEYREGDFTKASTPAIFHGCNAQGKFASGAAKCVRENYPEAYHAYYMEYLLNGLTVGQVIPAYSGHKLILNGITQEFYGYDGKVYASLDGIVTCIKRINNLVKKSYSSDPNSRFLGPLDRIAMPKIASGLGGLPWDQVEAAIEEHSTNFQPVVYVL